MLFKKVLLFVTLAFYTMPGFAQQFDSNDYWSFVNALRGQCSAHVAYNPDAALAKKMAFDSNNEGVNWAPSSDEVRDIYTSTGQYYVAQIAAGFQQTGPGTLLFLGYRIYFAPMNVWTPVNYLVAPADLCSVEGVTVFQPW